MASLQQWWKGFLTCNLLALSFSAATPFPIVSCRPCEPSLGEELVYYTQNLPLLSVGVPYRVGEQEQEVVNSSHHRCSTVPKGLIHHYLSLVIGPLHL